MRRLSAPSMACLRYIQDNGPSAARELEAVQRNLPYGDRRSITAIRHTPFNLETLGYLHRITAQGTWELTDEGRDVLLRAADQAAPAASARQLLADSRSQPTTTVPTRSVAYGRSYVLVPLAPRWIFDLGGLQ